jgi:hypothetical protein
MESLSYQRPSHDNESLLFDTQTAIFAAGTVSSSETPCFRGNFSDLSAMRVVERTIPRGYSNFVIVRVTRFLAHADSSSKEWKLQLTIDVCVSDRSLSGSDGSSRGGVKKM